MREIKFRGWDRVKGNLIYDFLLDSNCKAQIYQGISGRYEETDRIEIMQYTGLKDKNGKEIYEGDIIEIRNFFKKESSLFPVYIGKVVYLKDFARFAINLVSDKCHTPDYIQVMSGEQYEIIGNIYENPELLESEK